MRSLAAHASLLGALALVACSSDTTTPPPATTHPDATTTSTPTPDGSVFDDAASIADDAGSNDDAAPGPMDAQPINPDAMTTIGPSCTELEMCCGTLPAGQQTCFDRAGMGDEASCQMLLSQAQNLGSCLPPDHDAGMRPDGAGLSPECAQLAPCCAQAGALAGICDNIVARDNPTSCQGILDQLAMRGIMCAAPDSGVEPPDAGVIEDSGIIEDAGTSSVADGG